MKNTKKIFENYFKQNLNERLDLPRKLNAMANTLARALAKFRDQDNSNIATLDIDNIPEDEGLETEKDFFRKRPAFRALVRKKVKNFLSGVSQIDVLEPDTSGTADSDPINRFKQKHGATTTSRGVKESFEETPFGQLVADEINKIVSEMPEIKLALEIISEQEQEDTEELTKKVQELGRAKGLEIMNAFKAKLDSELSEKLQQVMDELEITV